MFEKAKKIYEEHEEEILRGAIVAGYAVCIGAYIYSLGITNGVARGVYFIDHYGDSYAANAARAEANALYNDSKHWNKYWKKLAGKNNF